MKKYYFLVIAMVCASPVYTACFDPVTEKLLEVVVSCQNALHQQCAMEKKYFLECFLIQDTSKNIILQLTQDTGDGVVITLLFENCLATLLGQAFLRFLNYKKMHYEEGLVLRKIYGLGEITAHMVTQRLFVKTRIATKDLNARLKKPLFM